MASYNAGSAASGAISGASIGSSFGPVGTIAGGLIGGVAGLFGSKKKKKKQKTVSTLDPQQQGLYDDYIKSIRGQGPFSDLYNYDAEGANNNFDMNVARPAYRNYQENIVPAITGQYRQGNIMNSSYSAEALGRKGRDVQENLDGLRSNTQFQGQQQSQSNKQNAINSILGNQTFAYEKPEASNPSSVDQILNSIAPHAGEWFGDYLRQNSSSRKPNASGPGGMRYA